MIRSLHLVNFKPFQDFTVEFTDHNVLIGPNNAGKSSIIQALRLIDLAARIWARTPQQRFAIPERRIPFSLRNARNLNASNADNVEITCRFTEGPSIQVSIPYGSLTPQASVTTHRNRLHTSIGFLPPVGPLEEDERLLDKEYVRQTMNTHLAPRHFRNLWRHFPKECNEFRTMLEKTWPGVTLSRNEPNPAQDPDTGNLYMFYNENRLEREVAWAGSGLQIWLQILTFLVKNRDANVLILDEPELYLHADVQRKIGLTAFDTPNSQVIIATHSIEILNEVEPDEIITVDPSSSTSIRLTDVSAVQKAISQIGSTQNIQLSRLARSKRCLFVEGEDFKLLKRVRDSIGENPWEEDRNFSVFSLEGFNNWTNLKRLDWVFHNVLNEQIQAFVILDGDYRTDSQNAAITQELLKSGVRFHVWDRKEIENYLLSESVVCLGVSQRLRSRQNVISNQAVAPFVQKAFADIAEELRDETFSQMLEQYHLDNRATGRSMATLNFEFTRDFNSSWQSADWRLARISGKSALRLLNQKLQTQFKVAISPTQLASKLDSTSAPAELLRVVREVSRFARS